MAPRRRGQRASILRLPSGPPATGRPAAVLGRRRAVFLPRGADLGRVAASSGSSALARRRGSFFSKSLCLFAAQTKPAAPNCVCARRLQRRSAKMTALHACTVAAAPRKVPFMAAFLRPTAELQIRDKTVWPLCSRTERSARNEQYGATARLGGVCNRFATLARMGSTARRRNRPSLRAARDERSRRTHACHSRTGGGVQQSPGALAPR